VASRVRFRGLGKGAARRALLSTEGAYVVGVSAQPAASVARAGRVVRYVNDYEAVVQGAHGRLLEMSSVPLLAGKGASKRPVDLALHETGAGSRRRIPVGSVYSG